MLLCGIISAQDTNPVTSRIPTAGATAASRRVLSFSGTIADDGRTLLSDKSEARWIISNPEVVKDYAGHRVAVRARAATGGTEIEVLKIRRKPEVTSAARLGDSAFRR